MAFFAEQLKFRLAKPPPQIVVVFFLTVEPLGLSLGKVHKAELFSRCDQSYGYHSEVVSGLVFQPVQLSSLRIKGKPSTHARRSFFYGFFRTKNLIQSRQLAVCETYDCFDSTVDGQTRPLLLSRRRACPLSCLKQKTAPANGGPPQADTSGVCVC